MSDRREFQPIVIRPVEPDDLIFVQLSNDVNDAGSESDSDDAVEMTRSGYDADTENTSDFTYEMSSVVEIPGNSDGDEDITVIDSSGDEHPETVDLTMTPDNPRSTLLMATVLVMPFLDGQSSGVTGNDNDKDLCFAINRVIGEKIMLYTLLSSNVLI